MKNNNNLNNQKKTQKNEGISKQELKLIIVEIILAIPLLLSLIIHLHWWVIPLISQLL